MGRYAAIGALLLLSACGTPGGGHCVKVKDLSPAEQSALGGAISQLPANSPIITAMGDYKRMRDESRVCSLITG